MQRKKSTEQSVVLVLREHDSVWAPEAKAGVLADDAALERALAAAGHAVFPMQVKSAEELSVLLAPYDPRTAVVFNWFEGVEPDAEDGIMLVQALERLGFAYTGADPLTLAAAQDKICARRILSASEIPIPRSRSVSRDDLDGWNVYPAIVQLANDHGSESLTADSIVEDRRSLLALLSELPTSPGQRWMVSEFIDGREFSVAMWGNGHIECLPLLEIDYSNCSPDLPRIRSYEAKWDESSPAYQQIGLVPPSDLVPALVDRIQQVALETYHAFRMRDYARVDVRLRDGIPYVIDVNANPCITHDSTFAVAAAESQYDYTAMLDRIVQLALSRRPQNAHAESIQSRVAAGG